MNPLSQRIQGMKNRFVHVTIVGAMFVALVPADGHAYIGPGAGLSAFGALLALLVTMIVAVFGFVWYPIKRLSRALKRRRDDNERVSSDLAPGSRS